MTDEVSPYSGHKACDTQFVARIVAGDCAAFERFETTYSVRMRAIARREFHFGEADAQDIAQDVLLRLVENNYAGFRAYRGEASLSQWLRTITRHRCLDLMRRRKHWVAAEDQVRRQTSVLGHSPEVRAEIGAIIRKLKTRDQRILRLYFFEGKSYAEIAAVFEVGPNTVASSLSRAKERLKRIML